MSISLRAVSREGKSYAQVPQTEYEIPDELPSSQLASLLPSSPSSPPPPLDSNAPASIVVKDGVEEDEQSDKQKLLFDGAEEEKKEEKKGGGGLPWKTLLSIYFIVWTESAVMNGFNPIIPGMCKDRFGMSEDIISIASGFLVGGYIFATFLSSFVLGHLSDIYGRQKFMLLGSGVGAICSVGFGLAPWYWLAFMLRFISGLCNANNALTRAVISDIVPRGPNRAQAYGYHGATVSFARAFSSALSGLTSELILDPNNKLLDDRYFVPALFAATMQFSAFFLNIIFVPESNKFAVSSTSTGEVKKVTEHRSLSAGVKEIRQDRLMLKLILSNCLSSFGNGAMLLAIVLYFSLAIEKYGLGLNGFYNGILFGWFGLAGVIFQIIFFKRLLQKKTLLWLFEFGNLSLALGCILMPTTSIVYAYLGVTPATTGIMWAVASTYCAIMAAGFMTCLPVITTIINNCANPERQGLISGTAQSFSSFLRAFGPILCGIIFAGSVAVGMPFLLFIFLACIYLSSYSVVRFGTSATEKQRIVEDAKGAQA